MSITTFQVGGKPRDKRCDQIVARPNDWRYRYFGHPLARVFIIDGGLWLKVPKDRNEDITELLRRLARK